MTRLVSRATTAGAVSQQRARRLPASAAILAATAAAILISATAPAPLASQVPDTLQHDTIFELEPIAVRAVRPSTTGGVSAIRVRLDSVRFRPMPLLEHVLRELPLVQVRSNSRGEAQLALRGAEERQIAILLDGVPLTLGWDHRTDLSVIPLTAAQSIQLVRGMSSVLHGPNVLGGVVEIGVGSEPVSRVEPVTAAAGLDHTGGYSLGASTGAIIDLDASTVVVRGGVGRRERNGLAAPADPAAVLPALAAGSRRVNSDLEHSDGFVTARYAPASGGWLSTTLSGFRATRGVPPELSEASPRLWRYPRVTRMVGVIAGGTDDIENPLGRATLDLNLGIDVGSSLIEDFAMPASPEDAGTEAGDFFRQVAETEDADDRTVTLRLKGSQRLAGGSGVTAAATMADVRHDEVITVGLANGAPRRVPGEYRQRLWSLGAEADVPFDLDGPILTGGRVGGGLVWDGADTPEAGPDVVGGGPTMTEWGARLGVTASTGGGAVLLHTALSRRGRFPALREMYSSALGRFEPNPNLRPEILSGLETGFTTRVGGYDLQVVGFHQRLDHAIARGAPPAASTARFMRVNRDQVRSTGLEVLAGYTTGGLTLETEFTLQSVEVIEPGSQAVRAEYEPELAGGIGGTLPLIAGIEAAAEVEYWGEQFCSAPSPGTEDYKTLEPSTRTDVQLARSFALGRRIASLQRLGVELAIDNLTDSTAYDQCGLPQPGRTLRLQVRVH